MGTQLPSNNSSTAGSINGANTTNAQQKINLANVVQFLADYFGTDSTNLPLTVKSLNGGPLSGMRNKHIGGHFDSNPWQRGPSFTVTASGTYVADRWRIDFDGAANISVAKVALPSPQVINGIFCRYGMKITVNSKSGNTFMRVSQRIEGVDTLTTLAATLQTAVLGSGSFSVPVQARQNFGTGGAPSADVVTPYTVALAVTGSMQQLNTGLIVPDMSLKTLGTGGNDFLATEYDLTNVPVGGYIVVALSGLEYGTQATVWEDRRRSELGFCQRYYEVGLDDGSGQGSNHAVNYGGYVVSGVECVASVGFLVPKRPGVVVTVTNLFNSNFPTSGSVNAGIYGFIERRTANATGGGRFISTWVAASEL